jgi:capsular polysaccharide biosynthesis protein
LIPLTDSYLGCYSKQGRGSEHPFFLRPTTERVLLMRRIMLMVTVALIATAMMVATAMPVLAAKPVHTKEQCLSVQKALNEGTRLTGQQIQLIRQFDSLGECVAASQK